MSTALRLHEAIASVCPIVGVSVDGNRVARVDYAPDSTPEQRAAAEAVASAFDWSEQAERAWQQGRSRAEAFALLERDDAVGAALRLIVRDFHAQLNLVREGAGLPPVSHAETLARLRTLAAAGWGDAGGFESKREA